MKKILIITGAIILAIALFWLQNRNNRIAKEKIRFLISSGKYTIGEITGKNYHSSQGLSHLTTIMYTYTVDGISITQNIGSFIPKNMSTKAKHVWATDNTNAEKGDEFLVLYQENNPENSILCLDKPIKNKSDFEKYIKEIELLRRK